MHKTHVSEQVLSNKQFCVPPTFQCIIYLHRGFTCPICGESYTNMKTLWQRLDEEIADTPMPDEYRNINVDILCKDCHKVFMHCNICDETFFGLPYVSSI